MYSMIARSWLSVMPFARTILEVCPILKYFPALKTSRSPACTPAPVVMYVRFQIKSAFEKKHNKNTGKPPAAFQPQ